MQRLSDDCVIHYIYKKPSHHIPFFKIDNYLYLHGNHVSMSLAMPYAESMAMRHAERLIVLKFKLQCPDCGAVVITPFPQAVVLEHCPGCSCHIWDLNDALMAELYVPGQDPTTVRNLHAEN
jgi:hypothetical protein